MNRRRINTLVPVIVILFLYGCAPKGRTFLFPDGGGLTGSYHKEGIEDVFENDSLRVAVRHVKESDYEGSALLKGLSDKKYVILSVSIENKSKLNAIYNPSSTVLKDDSLDYKEPLDYTDLYDEINGDGSMESGLDKLKGKFYDVVLTLQPGEKTTRLLIFGTLSKNAGRAELAMNEIYIGTKTVNLKFPFVIRPKGR